MDVHIDQHFKAKVYTSGSTIAGHVTVCPARDTPFDNLDILFTGIAATRLDFVQQYPSHRFKPFMKLRMPIPASDLPEDRVFRAGQRYEISFNFIVPHQLTIGACSHRCTSPAVREQHLRLPPTLGFWDADDQAPDMTRIEYAIKARATRVGQAARVMEAHHILKVLPSLPEDAPLDITFRDERYILAKTKTIRKSLFSNKTGRLTATATQPSAVTLSADGHEASTTSVHINVGYVPDSMETAPPKINAVTGKLVSTTFFGAAPADRLPNLGRRNNYDVSPCLNYMRTNTLFTLPVDRVSWMRQNVSASRRDSGYSSALAEDDASETDASEGQGRGRRGGLSRANKSAKKAKSPIKHTTDLDIPLTIPNSNRKFFIPSFHSCLISRTYTLQLSLSVGPTNTAVTLAIPLQVGVETIYEPQGGELLPSFESAMAQAELEEAEAHLQPRVLHTIPSSNTSLLPGYDELRGRTSSQ